MAFYQPMWYTQTTAFHTSQARITIANHRLLPMIKTMASVQYIGGCPKATAHINLSSVLRKSSAHISPHLGPPDSLISALYLVLVMTNIPNAYKGSGHAHHTDRGVLPTQPILESGFPPHRRLSTDYQGNYPASYQSKGPRNPASQFAPCRTSEHHYQNDVEEAQTSTHSQPIGEYPKSVFILLES